MKFKTKTLMSVLMAIAIMITVGCSSEPKQEIADTQAAIQAALQSEANVYAADELKKLQDDFTAAVNEIKVKSGKLFKSNEEGKKLLNQIKQDVMALKDLAAQRKTEAKDNAQKSLTDFQTALNDAKQAIEAAAQNKSNKIDLAPLTTELTLLNESIMEIQQLIDKEDFQGANEKLTANLEKAKAIIGQFNPQPVEAAAENVN
jgi:hypothetical protein